MCCHRVRCSHGGDDRGSGDNDVVVVVVGHCKIEGLKQIRIHPVGGYCCGCHGGRCYCRGGGGELAIRD